MSHPAQFSQSLYPYFEKALQQYSHPGAIVLDPFAGVGNIHKLEGYRTVGVEIEPDWANCILGDATALPVRDSCIGAIITSPTFANRMADHHEAKDGSYRRTYKHAIGHGLKPNNSGAMQWGDPYRELHRKAWAECARVLKPGGIFVLDIKDHRRKGQRVTVVDWHCGALIDQGFFIIDRWEVEVPHFRMGANRERYPEEVIVFERP